MSARRRRGDLRDRLVDDVRHFSATHLALGAELAILDRVHRVGASEATVFHCARILEALAAESLRRPGITPCSDVFSNLELLHHLNLIPPTTRHWAHALRRAGNDARHLRRALNADDAELALLFVERWLDWFFRHFRFGPRLPGLTGDRSPLGLSRREGLRGLFEMLDAPGVDPGTLVDLALGPRRGEFLETPSLAAILAEKCLDREAHDRALAVLTPALDRFPGDLRLRQLRGLHSSRTGDLADAIERLEALEREFPLDAESTGIRAGIYKRKWAERGGEPEWLERSHKAYLAGWLGSRRTSGYLGINAATTALWAGRPAESRRLAGEVRELLRSRARELAALDVAGEEPRNCWDGLTLAEAELLLGELAEARRIYRGSFDSFPGEVAKIKLGLGQAGGIARAMGFSFSADPPAAPSPPATGTPALVVGVTGHRTLPDDGPLRDRVLGALETLRAGGAFRLVALSSLAEGADRLVARLTLDGPAGGALRAVLPLEIADYARDFGAPGSRSEFAALLGRAESISILGVDGHPGHCGCPRCLAPGRAGAAARGPREAAYESCGRFVVDHSDVLIALWDGLPARGRGGTAEVVEYARRRGRPVVWIRTTPPFAAEFGPETRPGEGCE